MSPVFPFVVATPQPGDLQPAITIMWGDKYSASYDSVEAAIEVMKSEIQCSNDRMREMDVHLSSLLRKRDEEKSDLTHFRSVCSELEKHLTPNP